MSCIALSWSVLHPPSCMIIRTALSIGSGRVDSDKSATCWNSPAFIQPFPSVPYLNWCLIGLTWNLGYLSHTTIAGSDFWVVVYASGCQKHIPLRSKQSQGITVSNANKALSTVNISHFALTMSESYRMPQIVAP